MLRAPALTLPSTADTFRRTVALQYAGTSFLGEPRLIEETYDVDGSVDSLADVGRGAHEGGGRRDRSLPFDERRWASAVGAVDPLHDTMPFYENVHESDNEEEEDVAGGMVERPETVMQLERDLADPRFARLVAARIVHAPRSMLAADHDDDDDGDGDDNDSDVDNNDRSDEKEDEDDEERRGRGRGRAEVEEGGESDGDEEEGWVADETEPGAWLSVDWLRFMPIAYRDAFLLSAYGGCIASTLLPWIFRDEVHRSHTCRRDLDRAVVAGTGCSVKPRHRDLVLAGTQPWYLATPSDDGGQTRHFLIASASAYEAGCRAAAHAQNPLAAPAAPSDAHPEALLRRVYAAHGHADPSTGQTRLRLLTYGMEKEMFGAHWDLVLACLLPPEASSRGCEEDLKPLCFRFFFIVRRENTT